MCVKYLRTNKIIRQNILCPLMLFQILEIKPTYCVVIILMLAHLKDNHITTSLFGITNNLIVSNYWSHKLQNARCKCDSKNILCLSYQCTRNVPLFTHYLLIVRKKIINALLSLKSIYFIFCSKHSFYTTLSPKRS